MVEADRPHRWTIEATGDLEGRGVWRLEQRGDLAAVDYDWRVRVEKPGLKLLAPVLRPRLCRQPPLGDGPWSRGP